MGTARTIAAGLTAFTITVGADGGLWSMAGAAGGLAGGIGGELAGEPATMPDTPQARTARGFIAAVLDGSPQAIETFEKSNSSSKRLGSVPMQERIARLQGVKKDWGTAEVVRVMTQLPSTLALLVRTRQGDQAFVFDFSTTEPGKFEGLRMMPAEMYTPPSVLTADTRRELVEKSCAALDEGYVFPDVAKKMTTLVRDKFARGEYDSVEDEQSLANQLTADFRSISKDLHLAVRLQARQPDREDGPSARDIMGQNYGFRKVEVLNGNVGYLAFDAFVEGPEAESRVTGAMAFLQDVDALIVDLRSNGGGSPKMIQFITSYLFESKAHLNDMVDRDGKVVEEYWTLDTVPGKRLRPGIPIYVLTSGRTFSGAEEFSYNLKNLKRGTLVGETTGGGAHPVRGVRVSDHVVVGVPFMRARNPVSQTNWEGTGVDPDVKCPAGDALDKAIEIARQQPAK